MICKIIFFERRNMQRLVQVISVLAVLIVGTGVVDGQETAWTKIAEKLALGLPNNISRPLPIAVIYSGNQGKDRADELGGALARLSAFKVVERDPERIQAHEEELDFGLTDLVDQSKALKAGKLIGAKAFVYGKSIRNEKEERLSAQIVLLDNLQKLPLEQEILRFTHPASYGAMRSLILPGWGQWTLDRKGSGTAFLISTVSLGMGAVYANSQSSSALDDAFLAGSVAERDRLLQKERDWKSRRSLFLAGAGVVWISNVLHAAWVSSHTPVFAQVELREYPAVALNIRF
jgi:hypothetical protein